MQFSGQKMNIYAVRKGYEGRGKELRSANGRAIRREPPPYFSRAEALPLTSESLFRRFGGEFHAFPLPVG